MNYIQAFATALIEHLKGSVPKNTHTEGGCDTCGYGGTEVEDGIDEDALWREIEEFSATFRPPGKHMRESGEFE